VRRALPLLLAAALAACGSTPRRDLDFDRLRASLEALAADPELAKLALAERALAEAAVRRLDATSINAAEHVQLAYVAERRVDIAYVAAQTEREAARLAELQREHASLLLAASRRETEAVRAELDRQRQRELLQQEDVQRGHVASAAPPAASPSSGHAPSVTAPANLPAPPSPAAPASSSSSSAPAVATSSTAAIPPPAASSTVAASPDAAVPPPAAPSASATAATAVPPSATPPTEAVSDSQAAGVPSVAAPPAAGESTLAQRLAALAPDSGSEGRQITLEDLVFDPGTATLVDEAATGLARVAAWAAAAPAASLRVEGHTDATGSPDANRSLSLRRAEAVRDALIARGVAAARISVSGEGAAQPVASNDDPAGRARNRRVVVRLGDD
jgi:outer membrane protein OmpA-like peptidoglycan-associated protein